MKSGGTRALAAPLLAWLFRRLPDERLGVIVLSALVAHTGWHWMLDRGTQLLQYHFQAPELNAIFFAAVLRWALAAVALAALMWLVTVIRRSRAARGTDKPAQAA